MSEDLSSILDELQRRIANSSQRCPICGTQVLESKRYPVYLCDSCVNEATVDDNRRVSFTDEIDGHSLTMRYLDGHLLDVTFNPARGDDYPLVWVRGVQCEVQVAHFGGIVMIPTS